MAEIHIERKEKSIWPWIVGAIIAALLIWALLEMLDNDAEVDAVAEVPTVDQTVTDPALVTGTAVVATDAVAPVTPDTIGAADGIGRYAGLFVSDSMRLVLSADGTYTMQESAAGEGRGTWMHDASANAVHLTPADGSANRFFRIEGTDTLTPLGPNGEPAAQMTQLTRRTE